MSLLEFTLQPYKRQECVEESSLSTATHITNATVTHVTDNDKKSVDPGVGKSEDQEISIPLNLEGRMRNVFEAIVELHLSMCYPPDQVIFKIYLILYLNFYQQTNFSISLNTLSHIKNIKGTSRRCYRQ